MSDVTASGDLGAFDAQAAAAIGVSLGMFILFVCSLGVRCAAATLGCDPVFPYGHCTCAGSERRPVTNARLPQRLVHALDGPSRPLSMPCPVSASDGVLYDRALDRDDHLGRITYALQRQAHAIPCG